MIGAVTVELSPRELVLFNTLYNAGVSDIRNGSVTLNFDAEGTLMEVRKTELVFRRGKRVIHRRELLD